MNTGTIKKVASWGIVLGGIAVLGEAIAKLKVTSQPISVSGVVGEVKTMAGEAVTAIKAKV